MRNSINCCPCVFLHNPSPQMTRTYRRGTRTRRTRWAVKEIPTEIEQLDYLDGFNMTETLVIKVPLEKRFVDVGMMPTPIYHWKKDPDLPTGSLRYQIRGIYATGSLDEVLSSLAGFFKKTRRVVLGDHTSISRVCEVLEVVDDEIELVLHGHHVPCRRYLWWDRNLYQYDCVSVQHRVFGEVAFLDKEGVCRSGVWWLYRLNQEQRYPTDILVHIASFL